MSMRRPRGRIPPFKACKECGALLSRKENVCPVCGSTNIEGENWRGVLIVLDPRHSEVAKRLNVDRPVMKAIIVAHRVMV